MPEFNWDGSVAKRIENADHFMVDIAAAPTYASAVAVGSRTVESLRPGGLTPAQVDQYQQDGYLVVEDVLDAPELAAARRVVDELLERSRSLESSDNTFDLDERPGAAHPRVRRIKEPSTKHDVFAMLTRHDRMLNVVCALLGPDVRYQGGKLNLKPSAGGAVEWHQDFAFYPHTNDSLLACGIALDDTDEGNGCLLIIPGSHRGPILDHHLDGEFVGALPSTHPVVSAGPVVPVVVPAGGMSVHHCRALHASAPSRSVRQRRLLLQQYVAADAFPLIYAEARLPDRGALAASMVRGRPADSARLTALTLPMPNYSWDTDTIYQLQARAGVSAFDDAPG